MLLNTVTKTSRDGKVTYTPQRLNAIRLTRALFVTKYNSTNSHYRPLLRRQILILDQLLPFLTAFSTLVLKPSFSQSLPFKSHLSLLRPIWNFTTRCLAVTGGSSIGKCGRFSQTSWLLDALAYYAYLPIYVTTTNKLITNIWPITTK